MISHDEILLEISERKNRITYRTALYRTVASPCRRIKRCDLARKQLDNRNHLYEYDIILCNRCVRNIINDR